MQKIYKPNFAILLAFLPMLIPAFDLVKYAVSKGEAMDFVIASLGLIVFALPLIFLTNYLQYLIIRENGIYRKSLISRQTKLLFLYQDIQRISLTQAGQNKILEIVGKNYVLKKIFLNYYQKHNELVADLRSYIAFDNNPITLPAPTGGEVGKRVLYVLFGGIFFFIITMLLDKTIIHAWHTSAENMFSWLFFTIPLAMIGCYVIFKRDKKNEYPILTALLVGAIVGSILNNFLVTANRFFNEKTLQNQRTVNFKLLKKDENRQKWQAVNDNSLVFHDGYFHVHIDWKTGYNPNLIEGKTYQIVVNTGNLNDIYFLPNAFKEAKLLD